MSWPMVALRDVVRFIGGGTPSKNNPEYWDGDIPWATVKDIKGTSLDHTIDSITEEGLRNSASRLVPAGTVILPTRMALGKAAVTTLPVAINQDLKAAIPTASLNPRFLLHFFQSASNVIQKLGAGATVQGVTLDKLGLIDIPFPPIEEQERIAAVLDKADALRRQRQESLELTEKLLQSVFLDMFGDPETNPKGWKSGTLGGLVAKGDSLNYGVVQPGDDYPNGVPMIRVGDIANPDSQLRRTKRINPAIEVNYSRSRLSGGEVLIGCVGSIGASCIAPTEWAGANIARAVARVRLRKGIPAEFILQQIRTPAVQRFFAAEIRVVAQPTLNIKQIKETPILMPPPELIEAFASIYRKAREVHSEKAESAKFAEGLFVSLQQRAFRGELDLSRLVLLPENDITASIPFVEPAIKARQPRANYFLKTPSALEPALKKLDRTVSKGDTISWSVDYFKYRILAANSVPFSFADLMQKAEAVFEEPPPYDTIRELIFDLLGQDGKPVLLRQRFDLQTNLDTSEVAGRKEILFESVP